MQYTNQVVLPEQKYAFVGKGIMGASYDKLQDPKFSSP